MAQVPKVHMREEVAADLRTLFHASDRAEAQRRLQSVAQKYRESAPKLAEWIEAHAPEALTVFNLPEAHRKKLRTTNSLERLNKEINAAPAWPPSSPMKNHWSASLRRS